MKYNILPLKDSLIIKADLSAKKSAGGLILSAAGTREAQAPDKVTIIAVGEGCFDDMTGRKPQVGDTVVIAKYDGIAIEEVKEGDVHFEYRVIHDTRIRALLEEVKE